MSKDKELVGFKVHTLEYQTRVNKMFVNREPWKAPNPCEIRSYIPGTIIKINVKKGDSVKAGESLLVLEAMKMQNQIEMPFDGKIKDICVKEGDKVPKRELMILIEE